MFKKEKIKDFILGVISSFVLAIILDLFGLDTFIVRTMIVVILILAYFFIILLYKKNNKPL